MIAPLQRHVLVFAGGGTGGHLYPGLAVARALPASMDPVFLVPHDRGDVERIGGEFRVRTLVCPRIDRSKVLFPPRLARAVTRARRVLRELGAVSVVGLGGYASVPAALAAKSLGLGLYLMECNAVPGKATRFLARFADGIGLGMPKAAELIPGRASCRVTGTPLRRELDLRGDHREFDLEPELPTLLVLGGSQGAKGLNTRVLDGLSSCEDRPFQVLHCSGADDAARVTARYRDLRIRVRVVDFLEDIGRAYSVADLVLCRAGASTVAECAALRQPAVFVPYPWHRDRQQAHNAWESVRAGAARIIEEEDLDAPTLQTIVDSILLDDDERSRMTKAAATVARPGAAHRMAAHIMESLAPVTVTGGTTEFGG